MAKTASREVWLLSELPFLLLTICCTHLVMSCSQTLMHRSLGHCRFGGPFFHNHITFHHGYYSRSHLTSESYRNKEGNNTPFFLIPAIVIGLATCFVLPRALFLTMALTAGASFYVHVYLDSAYHVDEPVLARFAWFRRKQQLHFVHHLHANSNFAVVDFFWDRLLGTYREPEREE